MKTSKAAINNFLGLRKLAIAGVSRDSKKFGYGVLTKLKEAGIDVYLVHPDVDTLHGEPCYRSISNLPSDIGGLVILTPKTETLGVVQEAVKKGIPNLWIQQMSETAEAIEVAVNNKLNVISGQCIMMFAEPVSGFHKFHRNLKKFFGGLPK
jgi:predicted CoA-binding protein